MDIAMNSSVGSQALNGEAVLSDICTAVILTLPAEIRIQILSHVLEQPAYAGFLLPTFPSSMHTSYLRLDFDYSPSQNLAILLTCRQFYVDFTALAYQTTSFVVTDTYTTIPKRLSVLKPYHIASIRNIAFVAGARQFREMTYWARYPFDVEGLKLRRMTIVLHQSAHWHYPSDYTTDMVLLLRRLRQVETLKFVQNGANVKGFFKTWYNRLIGLLLKEDHRQRYDAPGAPHLEQTWWEWSYTSMEHSFELKRKDPKPIMAEADYLELVKPWIHTLMADMAMEEEDPDPRSRNGFP